MRSTEKPATYAAFIISSTFSLKLILVHLFPVISYPGRIRGTRDRSEERNSYTVRNARLLCLYIIGHLAGHRYSSLQFLQCSYQWRFQIHFPSALHRHLCYARLLFLKQKKVDGMLCQVATQRNRLLTSYGSEGGLVVRSWTCKREFPGFKSSPLSLDGSPIRFLFFLVNSQLVNLPPTNGRRGGGFFMLSSFKIICFFFFSGMPGN